MPRTVIEAIAYALQARENCRVSGNTEWVTRHTQTLRELGSSLPSGSGLDSGTTIDLDRSTADRIVLQTAFHHMNDGGMYDGWTDHTIVVQPSFIGGFTLRITGRDRNGIKLYLSDHFYAALGAEAKS